MPAVISNVRFWTHALLQEAESVPWAVVVLRALHDVQALGVGVGVGDSAGWAGASVGPHCVATQGSDTTHTRPPTLINI